MTSWRDSILAELAPHAARLTIAADPDGLLLEAGVLQEIAARGFELITVEDRVAFRFTYESRYRSRGDRGERTGPGLVLRTDESDLGALPYDLLHAGRRVSFSLGALFPHLSRAVMSTLERSDLDALYQAQTRAPPARPLGDAQTADFVLRHVFGIAPETIRQESDLLRFLLRRHYRELRIPAPLDDHLLRLLARNPAFAAWPLRRIMADREAFFAFLQERWPAFLDRRTTDAATIRDPATASEISFASADARTRRPVGREIVPLPPLRRRTVAGRRLRRREAAADGRGPAAAADARQADSGRFLPPPLRPRPTSICCNPPGWRGRTGCRRRWSSPACCTTSRWSVSSAPTTAIGGRSWSSPMSTRR